MFRLKTKDKLLLAGLAVVVVGTYLTATLQPDQNPILAIACGFVFAAWCREDASERNRPMGQWMTVGIFFLYPIFGSFYLLQSRGAKGLWAIGAGLAYFYLAWWLGNLGYALARSALQG